MATFYCVLSINNFAGPAENMQDLGQQLKQKSFPSRNDVWFAKVHLLPCTLGSLEPKLSKAIGRLRYTAGYSR